MALCFALGSTCFLVGSFPGYATLVGDSADAITFFVGSILFTIGGGLQSWLAWPGRHSSGEGRAGWWAAVIQSAGTLFFNVTTYQAMHTAVTSSEYNKLVWRPDWRGSICFLSLAIFAGRSDAWNARAKRQMVARQPQTNAVTKLRCATDATSTIGRTTARCALSGRVCSRRRDAPEASCGHDFNRSQLRRAAKWRPRGGRASRRRRLESGSRLLESLGRSASCCRGGGRRGR